MPRASWVLCLASAACGARTSLGLDGDGGAGGGAPVTSAGSTSVQTTSTPASSAAETTGASAVSVVGSTASATVASVTTGPLCTDDDECDDGVDCTEDLCQPIGCVSTPIDAACDDGLLCTIDACDGFTGCVNDPSNDPCDDGLACTIDTCDALLDQCVTEPCDGLCDDLDFCNGVERCDAAFGCVGGPQACVTDTACAASTCNEGAEVCAHVFPAGCSPPDVHILVTDSTGSLWDVAPFGTPTQTLIAPTAGTTHLDIAILGTRWFVADFALQELVPGTNQVLQTLLTGGPNSLAAGPDGMLYMANTTVYRVHPDTSAVEIVALLPPGHNSSGDIAFVGDRMFVSTDSGCGGALVEVDVATGASFVLGGDGLGCVYGLATVAGVLYLVNCDGKIGTFDPDTGEARILANTTVTPYGADALP